MKKLKETKEGITLIALVVTIIVLLILAGISMQLIFGTEGLITRAIDSRKNHKISEILEKLEIEKGAVGIETKGNTSIEKYLEHIVKEGIIDKEDIRETEEEKSKNIIVDNEYVFLVEEEEDKNIKITYEGEVKRLKPSLEIEITRVTTNSITVKAKSNKTKNVKYEYYIKDLASGEEYKLKETKKENEYTYVGLTQDKEYQVKVKIVTSFGDDEKESNIIRTTTLENLLDGNIEFIYTPSGWTNNEVIVEAKANIELQDRYRVQTSKEISTWSDELRQTFTENGTIYARLYDGINETNSVVATVTKIDKNKPSAKIELSAVTAEVSEVINAKITLTDTGGSDINLSNCKWVLLKDTKTEIGTNISSYTGGTLVSKVTTSLKIQKSEAGTYYLHILCADNAGNLKEIISNAITIKEPPTVEDLKKGQYVNYITPDGNTLKCAVLWDKNSTYGSERNTNYYNGDS